MPSEFIERCGAVNPTDGRFCTLRKDHTGKHRLDQPVSPNSQPALNPYGSAPTDARPRVKPNAVVGLLLIALVWAAFKIVGGIGATTPAAHNFDESAGSQSSYDAQTSSRQTNYRSQGVKHVVFKQSGSGSATTEKFDVSDDWDLEWSYNCENFANGSGNFTVMVYRDSDISSDMVNQLGAKGDSTEHFHSGSGSRYLSVNSECNWELEALSQ